LGKEKKEVKGWGKEYLGREIGGLKFRFYVDAVR